MVIKINHHFPEFEYEVVENFTDLYRVKLIIKDKYKKRRKRSS